MCNLFSRRFVVEESIKENKKVSNQAYPRLASYLVLHVNVDLGLKTWPKALSPKSTRVGGDFAYVSIGPDLERFGMTELEFDMVALFELCAYDVAAYSVASKCS